MDFAGTLKELAAGSLRRRLSLADRGLVNFCSNDYLGLAADPRLGEAAAEAAARYGWGAGAAPLISGYLEPHEALREALRRFFKTEGVLLFGSGYQANIGAIPVLVSEKGALFSDALNHASLIDGCRLAKAPVSIYRHCDLDHLESLLKRSPAKGDKLIVTESLFSMEGDVAPLADMAALAARYDALLYIDEAHAFGTCGPDGRGLWDEVVANGRSPLPFQGVVRLGTLGKAFGSFGAFILSSPVVTEYLLNRARSFIFATALPPAVAAASRRAIAIAAAEPSLRERLWNNVRRLASALDRPAQSPIFPYLYPGNDRVMQATERLRTAGLFVQGIRAPSVPEGKERLRITVSAGHTEEQIRQLVKMLSKF